MKYGSVVVVLFALVLLFVGPWLTAISLDHIINTPGFDFGDWFSALWLMIVFGGAGLAARG